MILYPGRAVVDVEESVAPATIERAIVDSGFPATPISVAPWNLSGEAVRDSMMYRRRTLP